MSTSHHFKLVEQLEDLQDLPAIRNVPDEQLRCRVNHKKQKKRDISNDLEELAEKEQALTFSYQASKHEKQWLIGSLSDFYHMHWFDDILRLIKGGGKEASVYQCLGNTTTDVDYLAAKVYRPRRFRQLRNDALYREGRLLLDDEGHQIGDDGSLHAIRQRTQYGLQLMHTSWIEHEFQTMKRLYEGGADVPKPYACGNNAILMEYIGWDDIEAPTLNTVSLSPAEAQDVFDRVIKNINLMLDNQRVHGDLSAYNILYCEGNIKLIDFPQAINPDQNRNAYAIFRRDLTRLCEYFQDKGIYCQPAALAESMWLRHGYPIKLAVHPILLEPETIE